MSRRVCEEERTQPSTCIFLDKSVEYAGNPLIDDYGRNSSAPGEMGSPVVLPEEMKANVSEALRMFRVNVLASDVIPLNRKVPDSRVPGCRGKQFARDLPTASVVITVHDEWPSVLQRTLYSVINRSPRHLLMEIILVDDNSTLKGLQQDLDDRIAADFPDGLVHVVRMRQRAGLVRARMAGVRAAKGDVIVILDSHSEVNVEWLEPLLTQIKADQTSVALSLLDYIHAETFAYRSHKLSQVRYGFDWRLVFYETFFRPFSNDASVKPGVVTVGTAFAVDRKYFLKLGGYDEGMDVWGGENLELSWRVWMCGGSMVHVPCSKVGHIARPQPYSFPAGRQHTEMHNYKRAVEVWMNDNHKIFVYSYFPQMKTLDAGNLTERKELKQKLGCSSDFDWFLERVWPELTVFDKNASVWGAVANIALGLCLDTHNNVYYAEKPFFAEPCHGQLNSQGFSLTKDGVLKSGLHCVVVRNDNSGARALLANCFSAPVDKWAYPKVNEHLCHQRSGLCLDLCDKVPCIKNCTADVSQKWTFIQPTSGLQRVG
ncbi:hypothetical protein C0Q70_20030 [Pomacea canaliculata]|uniref:Polypeptide N-acetylgalactosaminyltransferase n=1 Tax=Pomacea canaliculata TaxID=400727 RepID=A0A2T7NEF4_POMCA|nr:hypothetical protein C0Q70_20030 [Pomacea canaliculata]